MSETVIFPISAANKGEQIRNPNPCNESDLKEKDWVFINYTYKRFEGLTQRGRQPFGKS